MRRLNESNPFGRIVPAWQPDDFDRPAQYEQNGVFFDAKGLEIVSGKPLADADAEIAIGAKKKPDASLIDPGDVMSVAELASAVGSMPFFAWKKEVKKVLGDSCPNTKAEMLEALKKAGAAHEMRQTRHKGVSWVSVTGEENKPESVTPAPAAPEGVDLAAWARGEREYLFGAVQKAIRALYHRQVTETRDAIDVLIEEGVIDAARARRTE